MSTVDVLTFYLNDMSSKIWGSYSGDWENFCSPRYNAVYSVECLPTFRRNISAPSSWSSTVCHLLANRFLDLSIFDPEDEGDMFLRKILWRVTWQLVSKFTTNTWVFPQRPRNNSGPLPGTTNAFPQKRKVRWVTVDETRRFRSNGLPKTWDRTLANGVPYPVPRTLT
jgi:hypothetical protein